jgi:hypothetical protein
MTAQALCCTRHQSTFIFLIIVIIFRNIYIFINISVTNAFLERALLGVSQTTGPFRNNRQPVTDDSNVYHADP